MRRSEWMRQWRTLDWILVVLLVIHAARISLGAAIATNLDTSPGTDELIARRTLDYTIFTVRDRMPKIWRLLLQNTSVQESPSVMQNLLRERHQTREVFVFGDSGAGSGTILSRTYRSVAERRRRRRPGDPQALSVLERNQRSANLSYAMGSARKIQLYIRNRCLQLLPDGTVNGTHNIYSDYTILQRTTVDVGKVKIQGVATCLYLCMDMCGGIYASRKFSDDCVFNESIEEHHYNVYSSSYNSNSSRVLYLAINRHGQPRRLHISPTRSLGNLAQHTNSLTHLVDPKRVDDLVSRVFGPNYIKHGLKQLCDSEKAPEGPTVSQPKCNMEKKKPNKGGKGGGGRKKKGKGKKSNHSAKGRFKQKNKKQGRNKDVEHPTTTESDDTDERTFAFDDE